MEFKFALPARTLDKTPLPNYNPTMPKKAIITSSIVFFIVAILTGAFLFWHERKSSSNTDQPDTSNGAMQATRSSENTTEDEISSIIKGMAEGEYQFPPVDTSKWKTYRNDELGFEVKMPEYLEEVGIERDPKAGFVQVGFGKKGESYSIGEGTSSTSLFSIRSQDQSNPNVMPLRRYVESRIQRNHDKVLKLSLGGTNAIFLGTSEVFAYRNGKEWELNLPMVSMKRNLRGVNSNVKDEEEIVFGILQTFRFTR